MEIEVENHPDQSALSIGCFKTSGLSPDSYRICHNNIRNDLLKQVVKFIIFELNVLSSCINESVKKNIYCY